VASISYHRSVNDLQVAGWAADGPFNRPEWFALLEQGEPAPLIALASEGSEAVALPLLERGGVLTPLTNWYAFTFGELRTADAPDHLLSSLARDLARRARRIELTKLADEDGTLERLRRAFVESGWLAYAEPCDINHILRLKGRNYAAYLADRPGTLRTTLKRKAKKVSVILATKYDSADWGAYETIYAASWKPEEGDPALLRAFAQSESAAGRFRFALARHEGRPVAAHFWTVDGSVAYIHKLAYREDAKALSPGTTLSATLSEHVIDVDGVQMIDFGTGDDPYKRDWMEETRTRWRLICVRPANPRNWPFIAGSLAKSFAHKLVSRGARG
jgi:CelD/BcsL family acetyltransferase involved in cellulose biosynthesis